MKFIVLFLMATFSVFANVDKVSVTMAVNMLKDFEGYRVSRAWDESQYSIGYGTDVERVKKYTDYKFGKITKKQAYNALVGCVMEEIEWLSTRVHEYEKLPSLAKAALITLSYNSRGLVGPRLRKFIRKKEWDKAVKEIAWGHNPKQYYGLVKRRFMEAKRFAIAMKQARPVLPDSLPLFYAMKEKSVCFL